MNSFLYQSSTICVGLLMFTVIVYFMYKISSFFSSSEEKHNINTSKKDNLDDLDDLDDLEDIEKKDQ